jgi:hypothetical protein
MRRLTGGHVCGIEPLKTTTGQGGLQVTARKRAGYFGYLALFASAVALFAVLPATDASAQFFSRIFGRGEYREVPPGPPPYGYREVPPPHGSNSYARSDHGDRGSSGNPFSDFFGIFRDDRGKGEDKNKGNAFAHYCVRTCDGKFFPVNRGGKGDASLNKVCEAMCPAAETKIFSGAGIENATATDGKKYMSLPKALSYRKGITENCTCNGRDPFGVVSIDLENDPTLRTGDFVVRTSGVHVFKGNGAPHKSADFTPIKNAPNMNPALVKQLMAIKVLPNNPNAPFAMTVTVRQNTPLEPEVVNTNVKPDPAAPQNAQQNTQQKRAN